MSRKVLAFILLSIITSLACFKANKTTLTVAAVSMNAVLDKEENLQKFFYYMEEAKKDGATLIVFPEIALQQNPAWGDIPTKEELDYLYNTAETIPGSSTDRLAAKAKEISMYVIFGMTEKVSDEDSLYNASVFIGPDGIIGKYRKINLWRGGKEHLCWKKGKDTGVFDSPFGKVGLMICIDMHYWLGSELAKEGANFLVTVAAWPASGKKRFEEVTIENAAKTNLWHIVSNQVGSVGDLQDYGHSRIVDPNGNIIADTGDEEGFIIVKTELLVDL